MLIDTINAIAKEICENIQDIEVKEISGEASTIIEIRVSQSDVGKMIGKKGVVADAIRTIIYNASYKYKKRYTVNIIPNTNS